MIQKTVNIEAKAGLRSSVMVWNMDFQYPKSYCPSHNISAKLQIQSITAKNFWPEKPKAKKVKPILCRVEVDKFLKQACNKRKKMH